jgi:hypothetical protein
MPTNALLTIENRNYENDKRGSEKSDWGAFFEPTTTCG